jgi:hypothetical protein
MTQRTRKIIEFVLIGVSVLLIVMFVAEHFMTEPRPSWHKDLPFLALAFVIASGWARGRRRRSRQSVD